MIAENTRSRVRADLPTHREIATILDDVRTPHKSAALVCEPSYRRAAFDSHFVDAPFVFSDNGRYYMTFVGYDQQGYQTGLAVSDNLFDWRKEGLLIRRGPAGSVTENNVALTCILRDNALSGPGQVKRVNGKFLGTYHAYPLAGLEAGPAVIGLCTSDDLKSWILHDTILRPEDGAAWEQGGLYKSWILEHGGTYYLFYNAKDRAEWPWKEQTGVAMSNDLKHWTRYAGNPVLPFGPPGNFDDLFASDPCVLRHRDLWLMFYFGNSSDGHSRDGLAVSRDLLNWVKCDELLIDIGAEGAIDSLHAAKPAVISGDGRLFHFYCAVARVAEGTPLGEVTFPERRGIAMAWSERRDVGAAED